MSIGVYSEDFPSRIHEDARASSRMTRKMKLRVWDGFGPHLLRGVLDEV